MTRDPMLHCVRETNSYGACMCPQCKGDPEHAKLNRRARRRLKIELRKEYLKESKP